MLCHYAECPYAECRALFIIMLNVFRLNDIMLSVMSPYFNLVYSLSLVPSASLSLLNSRFSFSQFAFSYSLLVTFLTFSIIRLFSLSVSFTFSLVFLTLSHSPLLILSASFTFSLSFLSLSPFFIVSVSFTF